jgi:oxygen-independent coproporphyrinogen-3 oxidase
MSTGPLGVYIHVPFCVSRCDYCAFATWTDRFHLVDEYVSACARAAQARLAEGADARPATSVFFGGGTPSLLEPSQLARVLDSFEREPGAEVTVECNPETVEAAKLAGYRRAGVNRLSFGVQSMAPHVLQGLGRRHEPSTVRGAVQAAADTGFGAAYSIDLIMGGAGETIDDWRDTLEEILGFDPPPRHVSAYGLTVEPGTPLAAATHRHPDPDDQADKYLLADQALAAAGLRWYEISNWAVPGAECRHNQLYWSQGEYEGIGCAAHSHRIDPATGRSRRWWNVRTPERYIRLVDEGGAGESAGEELDDETSAQERLQLMLRTSEGVPFRALPDWESDVDLRRLVAPAGNRLVLTPAGRLLANEVAVRLEL